PGTGPFYAALVLLAGAAWGVVALAAAPLSRTSSPGARWAARGELRVLRGAGGSRHPLGRSAGARLALGHHGGRVLYAEHRHALVAFGPPQSGKSAGLAVPALLEWQGPAVASSIKTDLLAVTHARRSSLGRTFVFDPFQLAGTESHTWSPLGGAR